MFGGMPGGGGLIPGGGGIPLPIMPGGGIPGGGIPPGNVKHNKLYLKYHFLAFRQTNNIVSTTINTIDTTITIDTTTIDTTKSHLPKFSLAVHIPLYPNVPNAKWKLHPWH